MTEGRLPELSEVERRIGRRARLEGQREMLLRLLRRRFGELDTPIVARIEAASEQDLERWAERVLDAESAEDVVA